MVITYEDKQTFRESKWEAVCLGHGDRTMYVLTTDSIKKLSDKFNINLWCENDSTLNVFADGHINLMTTEYNNWREEYVEYEQKDLTQDEFNELQLREA